MYVSVNFGIDPPQFSFCLYIALFASQQAQNKTRLMQQITTGDKEDTIQRE